MSDLTPLEPNRSLLDLGSGLLARILSFLPCKDICRCAQACRTLRDAGRMDSVWRAKALERYPPLTIILPPHYTDHLALVKDDNRWNAAMILPLHDASCDYKHNRPDYYFECCIVGLQWHRAENSAEGLASDRLRVFFDARGELDLRTPLASSLGITVHREFCSRRKLRAQLCSLAHRKRELRQLVDLLEPQVTNDLAAAGRHHAALAALNLATSRHIRETNELRETPPVAFADLLTVLRPTGHQFVVATQGHYKGYLEFDCISQIETIADELPSSYRLKREVEKHGIDVVLGYANPVPVMPSAEMVDYHPVQLLHVPPGYSFDKAFGAAGAHFAPLEEMFEALAGESRVVERRRWEHVAQEFALFGQRQFETWLGSG